MIAVAQEDKLCEITAVQRQLFLNNAYLSWSTAQVQISSWKCSVKVGNILQVYTMTVDRLYSGTDSVFVFGLFVWFGLAFWFFWWQKMRTWDSLPHERNKDQIVFSCFIPNRGQQWHFNSRVAFWCTGLSVQLGPITVCGSCLKPSKRTTPFSAQVCIFDWPSEQVCKAHFQSLQSLVDDTAINGVKFQISYRCRARD